MASSFNEFAVQSCETCKGRKRACNKVLPSCGYCKRRKLECRYETPQNETSLDAATIPMPPPINLVPTKDIAKRGQGPPPAPLTSPFDALITAKGGVILDQMLQTEVGKISGALGLTWEYISVQFFRFFNRWLPVTFAALLDESLNSYANSRYPPSADLSVFILAITLVTLHLPGESKLKIFPQDMYLTVKTLFGRVQAEVTASTRLVQASLLVSAFEYACGRPDAAWISIGNCAKMAQAIGLYGRERREGIPPGFNLAALEERNVWWCIAIMERVILCEVPHQVLRPTSDYPNLAAPLPSESVPADMGNQMSLQDTPTLSARDAPNISPFGRQAQAAHLLSQLLHLTYIATFSPPEAEAILPKLRSLDHSLQSLLAHTMASTNNNAGSSSSRSESLHLRTGPVAATSIIVRALFTLHEYILAYPIPGKSATDDNNSRAACRTMTRIMIDSANDHYKRLQADDIDSVALSSRYNLRAALRWTADEEEGKILRRLDKA
ncbi:MAG: hypothetical protein LQ340_003681, partial [Diploschistes diacapsis]